MLWLKAIGLAKKTGQLSKDNVSYLGAEKIHAR